MKIYLSSESVTEVVIMLFGAGLVIGILIFLMSLGLSSALKIFKE